MSHSLEWKVSQKELIERKNWDLERKIQESWHRMEQWYNWCRMNGKTCYVSFSGGLDSTVMLHLIRTNPFLKNENIPVFFANTGLEYPEIVKFVRSVPGVQTIRSSKPFAQIVREYGYPVISKELSQKIYNLKRAKSVKWAISITTGWTGKRWSPKSKIPDKWMFLVSSPYLISDKCCEFMKKRPMRCIGCPFVGVRAAEGGSRELTYMESGCNAYENKSPRSWPIAFWKDKDVREYIKIHDVPYCCLYDMGHKRTGCWPCAFGIHLEKWPNRFQLMEKQHPKLWDACMDRFGLQPILEYINENVKPIERISWKWADYEKTKNVGFGL